MTEAIELYVNSVVSFAAFNTLLSFQKCTPRDLVIRETVRVDVEVCFFVVLVVHGSQNAIRKTYPDSRIHVFGSSGSGFGTKTSDMDMCLILDEKEFLAGHPNLLSHIKATAPAVPDPQRSSYLLSVI